MEFYAPVTLEHGLNDVTFMDDNRTNGKSIYPTRQSESALENY